VHCPAITSPTVFVVVGAIGCQMLVHVCELVKVHVYILGCSTLNVLELEAEVNGYHGRMRLKDLCNCIPDAFCSLL